MRNYILLLMILSSRCNLPLIDCVKDYFYTVENNACDNKEYSYDSTKIFALKLSPDFMDIRLNNEGKVTYTMQLNIYLQNNTEKEIILSEKNVALFCLIENDTIQNELNEFEFRILGEQKKDMTISPTFIFDKKYKKFLSEHQIAINFKVLNEKEIRSLFNVQSRKIK